MVIISFRQLLPQPRQLVLLAVVAALAARASGEESAEAAADTVVDLSGATFSDYVLGASRCSGPAVVFFSTGPVDRGRPRTSLNEEAWDEFLGAAHDLHGVACSGVLDCSRWPDACADNNIHRTPAIVLYPPARGAIQLYRGPFERKPILTAIARLVAADDRTVIVTGENIKAFLQDPLKPLKVLLFSSRKTTPIILQALSADARLWPYAAFGFARDSNAALLKHFGISEVPHMILQHGAEESTREAYQGEMGFGELQRWLLDHLRDHIFAGAVGSTREARVPESTDMEPGKGPPELTMPMQTRYELLDKGASGCPSGMEITSVHECEEAIQSLGLDAEPKWISVFPQLPRWCSVRYDSDDTGSERMHFNSATSGTGRPDLAPVCKVGPPPPIVASSSAKLIQLARPNSQQTRQNFKEIFEGEAWSMIYLKAGSLTKKDLSMMASLQERFRFLERHKAGINWAWANLAVDPKLAALFKVTMLPSAIVLKPQKPRTFAVIENSGRPADEDAIANLLTRVWNGKATMQFLPAEVVDTWSNGDGNPQASESQSANAAKQRKPSPASPGSGKSSESSAAVDRKKGQPQDGEDQYELLPYGTDGCPPGQEIASLAECELAIRALGLRSDPKWVSSYDGLPRHCSVREKSAGDSPERMHFNSVPSGKGRSDLAPVCRIPAGRTAKGPASATTSSEDLQGQVVELSRWTAKKELFSGQGYCLIWLSSGAITRQEIKMLLSLKERFRPQLEQRSIRLRWTWMNVRVERKVKNAFDAEALPSAVLVDPARPGFASIQHEERDGEFLPADEEGLERFINTLLGGDVVFTILQPGDLTSWAERKGSTPPEAVDT